MQDSHLNLQKKTVEHDIYGGEQFQESNNSVHINFEVYLSLGDNMFGLDLHGDMT